MDAGSSAGDEAARSLRLAEEHRRKAAWHEERAASFARGRLGEVTVAQALDELAAYGYRRIDDVRWPGRPQANIDHVLIGPGGLFVIDAKNWSGRVQVRDGVLRQNGYRREKELLATADAARAVHALLPRPLPRAEGALCLCGSADLSLAPTGAGIVVVEVDRVAAWVRGHPPVLQADEVAAAYDRLRRQLKPAGRVAKTAAIPDQIPRQWPGRAPVEPPAVVRQPARITSSPGFRFSPTAALVGRVILVLFLLDAIGSIAFGDRVGGVVMGMVCTALLLRLEHRRPLLTGRSTRRQR